MFSIFEIIFHSFLFHLFLKFFVTHYLIFSRKHFYKKFINLLQVFIFWTPFTVNICTI